MEVLDAIHLLDGRRVLDHLRPNRLDHARDSGEDAGAQRFERAVDEVRRNSP